jgi:hypothetical protein
MRAGGRRFGFYLGLARAAFLSVDTDLGGYLDLGGMLFFIVIGVGMIAHHDMDFMLRIFVPGMREPGE